MFPPRALVEAQLVEQLLSSSMIRGLNAVIGKFDFTLSTVMKDDSKE